MREGLIQTRCCALANAAAGMMRLTGCMVLFGSLTVFLFGVERPAAAQSLDTEQLQKAVSGQVVHLGVGGGAEVSIRYLRNGTMSGVVRGFAASMASNEPKRDTGQWYIENHQLCQRWRQWLEAQSFCYQLVRNGETVTWKRNDGRSGTARLGN